MPNDTDTDVMDSTDESSLASGGGGDPLGSGGGAASMGDVASATPMASPLGGQQPGQLPAMIGQPPLGAAVQAGAAAQGPPVGAAVHARHGGLLTGLAGVLLDGLAAGLMTPQSGQGFSQAAQAAYNMPMQRQQQAMQMEQFKTQQELQKAQISMAHVQQLQAMAMISKLSDEQIAGYTDEEVKTHEQWKEQGIVDQIGSATTREEAAQTISQVRAQDPDQGHNYWMWPTGHDGQGNITGWGVYKMDPDKPIGRQMPIMFPVTDPATGETTFKTSMLPATTPVWQANLMKTSSVYDRAMQDAAATEKAAATAKAKGGPLVVATMPDQSLKVMGAAEAQQQNLFNYPLKDPGLVTQLAGGMNDLQTGINKLAKVNIGNVQPGLAAALLEQQDPKLFADMAPKLEGLGIGVSGGRIAIEGKVPDRVMAELRKMNVSAANADTRNYVVALQAAYEGLSQLPRLQTFGKTGRTLAHQVEAAQRMLIQPGDDADMTTRKLNGLQDIVDPIKKGIPAMPGAELTPSFRDPKGGGRGPQGRAVRVNNQIVGYTNDGGKTMTPVGTQ